MSPGRLFKTRTLVVYATGRSVRWGHLQAALRDPPAHSIPEADRYTTLSNDKAGPLCGPAWALRSSSRRAGERACQKSYVADASLRSCG
jgi:hypothetical protein